MDADSVALLTTPAGTDALALAAEQRDPSGLSAAQALRARFPADLAAAALTQAGLRRKAVAKFGARAASMFFTPAGLEQATRPDVAAHHAARLRAAGVTEVVDLGCGIGSDALAFADHGLDVTGVERDPTTAAVARFNLAPRGRVRTGDAERLADELLAPTTGAFCDPARRTSAGRSWKVEDFTPPWTFVLRLLNRAGPAGVKLGPALPHALIPESAEAEWVSSHGDTVEVALWAGLGAQPGVRAAMVLPGRRLVVPERIPELEVGALGGYLYEPNGAVIRAGGVTTVGQQLQGRLLDSHIAYLSSDQLSETPFATAFAVVEQLPFREKVIRRWLREHRIGVLEIKKRGVDLDPAQLRKQLALRGDEHATLILTRTAAGAIAVIARRV